MRKKPQSGIYSPKKKFSESPSSETTGRIETIKGGAKMVRTSSIYMQSLVEIRCCTAVWETKVGCFCFSFVCLSLCQENGPWVVRPITCIVQLIYSPLLLLANCLTDLCKYTPQHSALLARICASFSSFEKNSPLAEIQGVNLSGHHAFCLIRNWK